MCIIVDACTLSHVFRESDALHEEFEPVRKWILDGDGKVVFGGSKYIEELGGYEKLFVELKKQGKAVVVDKAAVDAEEVEIKALYSHRDFDDPHLIAIIRCSRCCLVCTTDARAFPFLKNKISGIDFYDGKARPPKIYKNKKFGQPLLCARNIAAICRSC